MLLLLLHTSVFDSTSKLPNRVRWLVWLVWRCHHSDARFVFVFASFYLFTRTRWHVCAWRKADERARRRGALFQSHIITSRIVYLCSSRILSDYSFRIFGLCAFCLFSLQPALAAAHSIFDLYSFSCVFFVSLSSFRRWLTQPVRRFFRLSID